MTRLEWGAGLQNYTVGLDRGVFYPEGAPPGEAWDGLVSVQEATENVESRKRYFDGRPIGRNRPAGEFSGAIEAYSYPESFFTQVLMPRKPKTFGLSYRVQTRKSIEIHLVYNVLVDSESITHRQREVDAYSWNFTTLPVPVTGFRPSAHLIVNGDVAYSAAISDLEDMLYGTNAEAPRLPLPDEIISIFEENALLRIIDHGDGTWTAIGPDEAITMITPTEFEIDWPSATYLDEETYTIRSL